MNDIGYTPRFIGFTLCIAAVAYGFSIPIVQLLSKRIQRRGVLLIGLFLEISGLLLTGQSTVFNYYNPTFFICCGYIVFGLGFAMLMIPTIPEILVAIEEDPVLSINMDE